MNKSNKTNNKRFTPQQYQAVNLTYKRDTLRQIAHDNFVSVTPLKINLIHNLLSSKVITVDKNNTVKYNGY